MLPSVLPRLVVAWLVAFVVLVYLFKTAKKHMRRHVLKVDDHIRAWARGLRYRLPTQAERHLLTWFFRFWTNFGSAPSLCTFCLALPLVMYYRASIAAGGGAGRALATGPAFAVAKWWLLPGLCYTGAMVLSYVVKRVFKRLRPPRPHGAFGHKLKDGSFPSGHSLTVLVFWSMVVVAWAHAGATSAMVAVAAVMAALIAGLTGLSRIYLGVHFPSDVAGGYVIGIVWNVIAYLALASVL